MSYYKERRKRELREARKARGIERRKKSKIRRFFRRIKICK